MMVDRNHLRLPQDKFTWDCNYKDGKPNYSVKVQCLDGSKYREFDGVLRVPIEPINRERFRQEIVFVLECKYRSKRTFTYKDVERFAQNLANHVPVRVHGKVKEPSVPVVPPPGDTAQRGPGPRDRRQGTGLRLLRRVHRHPAEDEPGGVRRVDGHDLHLCRRLGKIPRRTNRQIGQVLPDIRAMRQARQQPLPRGVPSKRTGS